MDINVFDQETLWRLYKYVNKHNASRQNKRKSKSHINDNDDDNQINSLKEKLKQFGNVETNNGKYYYLNILESGDSSSSSDSSGSDSDSGSN